MREKTVDVALVAMNGTILLITRNKPPFMDKLVLPGGHIETGETERDAAVRELSEEVGLTLSPDRLSFLTILDSPGRDPRGEKISSVFVTTITDEELRACRAGSDARSITARNLLTLTANDMGFDHYLVVKRLNERSTS